MTCKTISYQDARQRMKPGDVVAFGGQSAFSKLIKFTTRSDVSHVGIVMQTQMLDETSGRFFNQVMESTIMDEFAGVTLSRFSERLRDYDGEVWWLPLREDVRRDHFDQSAFFNFMFRQNHKPYDYSQALASAIDGLDAIGGPGFAKEELSRLFCSELVAAGLENANVVRDINSSEVTPIELCRWDIFEPTYFQLKGDDSRQIRHFNSVAVNRNLESRTA
ncbi:hypothetical protein NF212_18590 [Parasalinivibrio latis]|uniref:hypothetical protein n=1 Tax=Parasalinivibrio latis TaxID=2952610 RepID=UPI0030DF4C6B